MEEKKNSLIDGILAQANNSEPRKILYKTKKSAMNALKKNYLNGFSMSDELRNDREFILDAMNKGLNAYPCASEEVRSDEELAWKYVNLRELKEYLAGDTVKKELSSDFLGKDSFENMKKIASEMPTSMDGDVR